MNTTHFAIPPPPARSEERKLRLGRREATSGHDAEISVEGMR